MLRYLPTDLYAYPSDCIRILKDDGGQTEDQPTLENIVSFTKLEPQKSCDSF